MSGRAADRRAEWQRLIDLIERTPLGSEDDAERLIVQLIRHHGARFHRNAGVEFRLRLAGLTSSCTWGRRGLLGNWTRLARARLEVEAS